MRFRRPGVPVALAAIASTLQGCVPNSSNLIVTASSASMNDREADIVLELHNPGKRRLIVDSMKYEVSHGEASFPLASGIWRGRIDVDRGGEASLPLQVFFSSEPIESDTGLLHLTGQVHHEDRTGFLGLRSMDLTETPFQIDLEAQRN